MRRIVKTCNLSAAYKAWLDDIEAKSQSHGEYDSSSNPFYWDVVMNLFHCQRGLCAYTEMSLCSDDVFDPNKWVGGQYVFAAGGRPQVKGDLEHFDNNLKKNRAWLWDNLFMVDGDINRKVKGFKSVDPILKPDSQDYNEFEKLEYDFSSHVFIAALSLPDNIRKRINDMILVLGLNYDPIRTFRGRYFARILKEVEFGMETWESVSVDQFPTAFEMIKRQMQV